MTSVPWKVGMTRTVSPDLSSCTRLEAQRN